MEAVPQPEPLRDGADWPVGCSQAGLPAQAWWPRAVDFGSGGWSPSAVRSVRDNPEVLHSSPLNWRGPRAAQVPLPRATQVPRLPHGSCPSAPLWAGCSFGRVSAKKGHREVRARGERVYQCGPSSSKHSHSPGFGLAGLHVLCRVSGCTDSRRRTWVREGDARRVAGGVSLGLGWGESAEEPRGAVACEGCWRQTRWACLRGWADREPLSKSKGIQ